MSWTSVNGPSPEAAPEVEAEQIPEVSDDDDLEMELERELERGLEEELELELAREAKANEAPDESMTDTQRSAEISQIESTSSSGIPLEEDVVKEPQNTLETGVARETAEVSEIPDNIRRHTNEPTEKSEFGSETIPDVQVESSRTA